MSESRVCSEARILLDEIRPLKEAFDVAYESALRTTDPSVRAATRVRQQVLTEKLDVLKRLLWWHLEIEERLDLQKQYEAQLSHLRRVGILRIVANPLSDGSIECVNGIDGRQYPPPSFAEILAHIKSQQDRLQPKLEQGFRKMLLVPFATNIGGMVNDLIRYLKTMKTASGKTFVVDPSSPIMVHNEQYEMVSNERTILYKGLKTDQPTMTKHWSLVQQSRSQAWDAGWHVLFVEEEERQARSESLEDLQAAFVTEGNPRYGEKGMTPEEWIVDFITHLEETGRFLDAGSKAVLLAGAYFQNEDSLPCVRSTDATTNRVHFGEVKMKDVDQYASRTVVRV